MLKVCAKEEFLRRVQHVKSIICFGAGKRSRILEELFGDTDILDKIEYVIDNDESKHHSGINLGSRLVEVIAFESLKGMDLSKTVFLITCATYPEILDQIESEKSTMEVETYCLSHQIALEKDREITEKMVPESLKRSDVILIPKTIHYCWFGRNPLPDKYKKWMESWHKFCPDYEIVEWNEDHYDVTKNRYMRQAYESEKWGFVSDYARLDIIHQYGGIYLDTDVELVQNLDDLLWQKGFAVFEGSEYVALGLGFGAMKGLPIMREILELYENIEFVKEDGSLNLITCPVLHTELLKKKGLITNGEYQIVDDLTVYPEKVMNGKSSQTRQIKLAPYTKAIHHYDGSWLDEKERTYISRFETDMGTLESERGIRNGNSIHARI